MFLYTSFEILLYVVSIFNTSADVKSLDFHPDSELSDQIISLVLISGLLIFIYSKGLLHHRNFHLPYH